MNYILELGKSRISDPNISNTRYIFNIFGSDILLKDLIYEPDLDLLINLAINQIKLVKNIDLNTYKPEIIQRKNDIGFKMNWHIDDCSIHRHKQQFQPNEPKINNKYTIYHKKPLPVYTMIIYLSGEFTGGEFEFIDKLIKPSKYDVIFFDSREVHKVRELKGGHRENVLIKFYENK